MGNSASDATGFLVPEKRGENSLIALPFLLAKTRWEGNRKFPPSPPSQPHFLSVLSKLAFLR